MKKLLMFITALISLQSFGQDTAARKLDSVLVISIRANRKVPVSQELVKGSEVKKSYQGQEMPVILSNFTSITSQTDGGQPQGYSYFRIRGIDQSRVNMTLNGAPLNEPEDQGVYTSNYPGFLNSIESMQVQRGVGTSTNGVASYGGSINFQSSTGLDKLDEVSLSYGSFNTKRINLTIGTGLVKNKFSLFTNLSGFSTDGYRYNSGGKGYSGFISGNYYTDKSLFKFTAFTGLSENGMAWLPVSLADIKIDPRTNYNANDASDKFQQSLIQFQYVRYISEKLKFSTTAFYNRLDGKYDYFMSGNRSVKLGSNFYGVLGNLQYTLNTIKINYGISLNGYNRRHTNYEDHIADYGIGLYSNNGIKNEFSTFLKVTKDINNFTLFGDAQYRYTDFKYNGDVKIDKMNWNFFNPKIGIIYNITKNYNVYASVGHTKREPTRTNLFGGDDNLVTLNLIKPEQVLDYELGVNYKDEHFNIQADVYYMDFKNEITPLGSLGANGLPLMVNVDKSFRNGIETNVKYVSGIFEIGNNINLSHNEVNDNGFKFKPLYTPTLVINQTIKANLTNFSIELTAKYHDKGYINFDNTLYTPSFLIFSSNFNYTYKNYVLSLQVNNLTNRVYYTSGNTDSNGNAGYFTSPLSSVYATLKINL